MEGVRQKIRMIGALEERAREAVGVGVSGV